jgi:hypothetical protein
MVLKTSMWAKRHYVRFKNKQPKAGQWTDWGLRRQSAKRRETIRKERAEIGGLPSAEDIPQSKIAETIPGPPSSPPEMPGDPEPRN